MIILTSFKPFKEFGFVQRVAIESWRKFAPATIICVGDHEEGVVDACKEYGIVNIPTNVAQTDFNLSEKLLQHYGSPLLDYIVGLGEEKAYDDETICITNGDIIFTKPVKPIEELFVKHPDALACARRFGISGPNMAGPEAGTMDAPGGADVFMWRKGFFSRARITIPKFILGRAAWDNWMMGMALKHGKPALDITDAVHGCHPYHGYRHMQTEAGAEYNRGVAHYSNWKTLNDDGWTRVPG